MERQFRRYFAEAVRTPGMTGVNLLITLESRFDNVIYRLGLADSRPQARQLVTHGHFDINGLPVNIASYVLKPGDVITVHGSSKEIRYFREIFEYIKNRPKSPEWLSIQPNNTLTATILRKPERAEIELQIKENLIVEYYSR